MRRLFLTVLILCLTSAEVWAQGGIGIQRGGGGASAGGANNDMQCKVSNNLNACDTGNATYSSSQMNVPKLHTTGTAGTIDETCIVAPSTPSAGTGSTYCDSTTKRLTQKDDAGTVTSTVNPNMAVPIWLPGAGCDNATAFSLWDLPTATPAVATCVTGTNIQKGVLAYADTAGGFSAQNTIALPATWTTTGGTDITLYWTTSATSGNAKWTVSIVCTAVNASATDDPTFATSNTVTTAAPGSANQIQTSTITGATLSSCTSATALLMHIKVFRDGNDGSDTIGATANLIGVQLTIRRSI